MVAFLVALADANVPVQTDGMPASLLKKLQPGKISGFLGLGNVGPCVIKVLKRIQAEMRLVAGDTEDEAHLPATQVCQSALLKLKALTPSPLRRNILRQRCFCNLASCLLFHSCVSHCAALSGLRSSHVYCLCRCSRLRECE